MFVFDILYFIVFSGCSFSFVYPMFDCYGFFSPGFDFLSTSQEIGWKECLRYDLFSAKWDVETPSRAL